MRGTIRGLAITALLLTSACTTKLYPTLYTTTINVECTEESAPAATEHKTNGNTTSTPETGRQPEPTPQDMLPHKKVMKLEGSISPYREGLIHLVDHSMDPSCPTKDTETDPIFQLDVSWCWAASAEAVMKFQLELHNVQMGMDINQCDIVKSVYYEQNPQAKCCDETTSCQHNGSPRYVFNKFRFHWQRTEGPLEQETLAGQICSNGPFIYFLRYQGGGGHFLVVRDYEMIDGEMMVWVHDLSWTTDEHDKKVPTNFYPISYDDFKNGMYLFTKHTHDRDFVQIYPPGVSPP